MNSIKSIKILWENDKISKYYILMVEDMYLEKSTQYYGGEYVGACNERKSL